MVSYFHELLEYASSKNRSEKTALDKYHIFLRYNTFFSTFFTRPEIDLGKRTIHLKYNKILEIQF